MSLLRRYGLMLPRLEFGVVSFVGIATTPATGGASSALTITLTPPAGIVAGDLVIAYIQARSGNHHPVSISNAGGQTWNNVVQYNNVAGNGMTLRMDWCQFNGTWSANPSWTFTTGTAGRPTSGQLIAFHSTAPKFLSWGYDGDNFGSLGATPPIDIVGRTTLHPATISVGYWYHSSSNSFSATNGVGWSLLGIDSYRVITELNQVTSYAYKNMKFAQGTGNVQKNFTGTGPFALQWMHSWNVNIQT